MDHPSDRITAARYPNLDYDEFILKYLADGYLADYLVNHDDETLNNFCYNLITKDIDAISGFGDLVDNELRAVYQKYVDDDDSYIKRDPTNG